MPLVHFHIYQLVLAGPLFSLAVGSCQTQTFLSTRKHPYNFISTILKCTEQLDATVLCYTLLSLGTSKKMPIVVHSSGSNLTWVNMRMHYVQQVALMCRLTLRYGSDIDSALVYVYWCTHSCLLSCYFFLNHEQQKKISTNETPSPPNKIVINA